MGEFVGLLAGQLFTMVVGGPKTHAFKSTKFVLNSQFGYIFLDNIFGITFGS